MQSRGDPIAPLPPPPWSAVLSAASRMTKESDAEAEGFSTLIIYLAPFVVFPIHRTDTM